MILFSIVLLGARGFWDQQAQILFEQRVSNNPAPRGL